VARFLRGEISFNKIPDIISSALDRIENHIHPDLETLVHCDTVTRSFAAEIV